MAIDILSFIRFNSLFCTAIIITLMIALPSCNTDTTGSKQYTDTITMDTANIPATSNSVNTPQDSTDNAILYFTIADTSQSYYILRDKMYALSATLHWPVDTMGRYYNTKKNLIAVPDNDEDEMYRGEYYPRRFPSQTLSLEYYQTYMPNSTAKNIALVAGIYESQKDADSLLALLKSHAAHAFVIKANVFEGCMH